MKAIQAATLSLAFSISFLIAAAAFNIGFAVATMDTLVGGKPKNSSNVLLDAQMPVERLDNEPETPLSWTVTEPDGYKFHLQPAMANGYYQPTFNPMTSGWNLTSDQSVTLITKPMAGLEFAN